MATIILSRGALAFAAKDLYKKMDEAQEKLFAYFYHLDKGDDESANIAFQEFLDKGDEAAKARRELLKKRADWAMWRANRR
ncbi:hypothetical protein D3M79_10410 [Rodentibacter pneumotropicus]|uniref:hypothetical protein n=1 Tax=Rodentibacter pneumotropicus TaxID=758 RepID=UPI0009890DD3|nr:hypothetical protein [Rodentibacter pneumotropicus]OOF60827.1 hypothetical protein BH925_04125 [Rodentibacter pneumotropicus]TGZ98140.1 hypothetical protein D3M79_10410 [Rodentibacter pneumotropicus]